MMRATVLGLAAVLGGCAALPQERKAHLSPLLLERQIITEEKSLAPADIYNIYLYASYDEEIDLSKYAQPVANNSQEPLFYIPGKPLIKKEGNKAYALEIHAFRTYIADSLFEKPNQKLSSFCRMFPSDSVCNHEIIKNIQYLSFGTRNIYVPRVIETRINEQSIMIRGDPVSTHMRFSVTVKDKTHHFSFDDLMYSYVKKKKPVEIIVIPRQTH